MPNFSNKTVVVTGASRGQGEAEARLFASLGAHVYVCDVLDAPGRTIAQDIRSAGGIADYCHLDVTDTQSWCDLVTDIKRAGGGVHVLVNNAGVALREAKLMNTTLADWQRVLNVNLTGAFLGIQAVAPLIRDSGGGAIVNIGSLAGIVGHFAAAYSASKWGLRGLTRSAAMELVEWKIRVNAIHPGLVSTGFVDGSRAFVDAMEWMTPFERGADPDEIAAAVAFLASEDAAYITGIDLPIDGGFSGFAAYRRVVLRAQGEWKR